MNTALMVRQTTSLATTNTKLVTTTLSKINGLLLLGVLLEGLAQFGDALVKLEEIIKTYKVERGSLSNYNNDIKATMTRIKSLQKEIKYESDKYKALTKVEKKFGDDPEKVKEMRETLAHLMQCKRDVKAAKNELKQAKQKLYDAAKVIIRQKKKDAKIAAAMDKVDKANKTVEKVEEDIEKAEAKLKAESVSDDITERDSMMESLEYNVIDSCSRGVITTENMHEILDILESAYEAYEDKVNNMRLSVYEKFMNDEITESEKDMLLEKIDNKYA